jgi:integrase
MRHDARHGRDAGIRELRDAGDDASIIAKVVGHSDEALTRRVYSHTADARCASTTSTKSRR